MEDEAAGAHVLARWMDRALTALIAVVMFAMMMLTTVDVAGRYLFNTPVKGGFEIITFLLATLVFASLPLITWDETHITVSLVENWVRGRVRWTMRTLVLAASAVIVGVMTMRMWIQGDLMAEGQHITGFLEWPIAPMAYFMSVLSGLTTVTLVVLLALHLLGRDRTGSP